jgi:hypothetical protein
MLPIIEGFAIETEEGYFFTVKGLLHSPDRVIAYLRYLPHPHGDRQRAGIPYQRVYRFQEQQQILQEHAPQYLARDPVLGIPVQSVPRCRIQTVYDPCAALMALYRRGPADAVEEQTLRAAALLQESAGVPPDSLGISGSVLLGLHHPNSDIDLIVYGDSAGRAVHRALHRLFDTPGSPLHRPGPAELAALHAAHSPDTPLSLADFARLQGRKVNEGLFEGRPFFIRFVKQPAETGEAYGDRRFGPVGRAIVRAVVTNDRDAMFTPCRYGISEAVVDSASAENLSEIVSFRGRFTGQARAGERVIALGNLELVVPLQGTTYHRLVVGGAVGDYLAVEGWHETD